MGAQILTTFFSSNSSSGLLWTISLCAVIACLILTYSLRYTLLRCDGHHIEHHVVKNELYSELHVFSF